MVPFYAARVSDPGPGDLVQVECACGHTERLTAAMLITAGVGPDERVQGLERRMRKCDEKGRAVISIRCATNLCGRFTTKKDTSLRAARPAFHHSGRFAAERGASWTTR